MGTVIIRCTSGEYKPPFGSLGWARIGVFIFWGLAYTSDKLYGRSLRCF